MKNIYLKRLLQLIPVVILVSIFSFLIIQAAPGDPINNYVKSGMTEEQVEQVRKEYGLDGKHCTAVWQMAGTCSARGSRNIYETAETSSRDDRRASSEHNYINGDGTFLALIVSIPLGLWAGLKKNKLADNVISFISYLGISIPPFWLGMVLIIIFALKLKWLPTGGMHTLNVDTTGDLLWHLILPAFVLSLNNMAVFTRYIRSNTISQLEEDYVVTAISKGTSKRKVLFHHVLKNCLLPIITLAGINIAGLVCGSFVIESVFSWPGIGRLAMEAVGNRDYPVIMGFTMFSCIILVLGNLLADILYAVADPRIRQGGGRRDN